MNRSGPVPQNIRSVPGNVFQSQALNGPRSGGLGSGRLQNGKLSGNTGWGTGFGGASATGLQGAQARSTGAPLSSSSFAQTIGGSQNQSSLDPAEFPSLSSNSQPQQVNSSHAIWGNSNSRTNAGQAPVQRPQTQNQALTDQNPPTLSQQPHRSESQNDPNTPFPPLTAGIPDHEFRYTDHAGASRQSRAPGQQGHGDDFPPLGGLGDIRQPGQQGYSAFGNSGAFMSQQQHVRNVPLGQSNENHLEGLAATANTARGPSPGDIRSGGLPSSRSPLENGANEDQNGQNGSGRVSQNAGTDPNALSYRGGRSTRPADSAPNRWAPGQQPQPQQADPSTDQSDSLPRAQMGEIDRFGLAGLMADLKGENGSEWNNLNRMDLSNLGLDLDRQGPLHVDWAGPFSNGSDPSNPNQSQAQPRPIIPAFTLPAAYTVTNVPPLESKIPSFSDETLFAIFYQCPRDVAQELAANELYSRDWRWHKKMQQWMMKAKEFGEPMPLPSGKEERGWYYFFDVRTWRRDRKEFILNYEHLYHGPAMTPGVVA